MPTYGRNDVKISVETVDGFGKNPGLWIATDNPNMMVKVASFENEDISQAISRNTLSNQAVEMLAMKFNINFDDYAPDKQEEQQTIMTEEAPKTPSPDVDTGKQLIDYFMDKLDHLLGEHTMSLLLIEASVEAALAKKGL